MPGIPDTIHGAFAARVTDDPTATAIIHAGQRHSYAELDRSADAIARQLRSAGVGPGSLVPVLLESSVVLPAALLAVLRCGAGYAALDPRWPAGRIENILDQLNSPLLISTNPAAVGGRQCLDPLSRAESELEWSPLEWPAVSGADAASVFFTSGTSGVPKGVISPHQATTRLFGPAGLAGFHRGAVVTQSAPPAWDAFSLEVWGALTTGGTLVLTSDEYFMPFELAELRQQYGVNCCWLTASLFNLFVDTEPECFTGFSHVYTGGERLSPSHVRRFLEQNPRARLFNGYGPVENCVFATVHPITLTDCAPGHEVPIGRPVAGTGVHILLDGQPCAPGQIGEIVLSGTGLAIGYLGQPDLTERQLPTLLIDDVPTRVYLTGDRGSIDESGTVHFRDRTDRQVKVHGHRLDLGEVEHAARLAPGVAHCVAVPLPGPGGSVELIGMAYVADQDPESGGSAEQQLTAIRYSLAGTLPSYAVPGVIRRLAAFPTTANGKLDSAALTELLRPNRRTHPMS